MRVLGIDPGATGALAFLRTEAGRPVDLEVLDMPVHRVRRRMTLDEYALARAVDARISGEPIAAAVIEQGGVRPQNGRVGAAAFWLGLGAVRGVLAANFVPIETVSPGGWKRAMRLTGDKDASRARASALLPQWAAQWERKKDHGRAEAALIALHGATIIPFREARETA
jgi:crossover junction endodeoxyribonuclease RuvC